MPFKLSPSDLSFLYHGCKRCYYLKVKHNITQPSIPLPAIFTKIAGLLKNHYSGKRTDALHPGLPPGLVQYGEKFVKSKIIEKVQSEVSCFIYGRFDIVVAFDDGTYGVIDFKTGNAKKENIERYARQLQAYAYALENPAQGALSLSPVSKLGLLFFYPTATKQKAIERIYYEADVQWVEVPKNEESFLAFTQEILSLLELDEAPDPSLSCQWCNYPKMLKGI